MNQNEIDNLINHFGTPVFIMDEQGIINRFYELQNAVKKLYSFSRIAISYKTNLLPGLLALLHQAGADAEVVSGVEYVIAKKIIRSDQKIIFNGPMKLEHELIQAIHDEAIIHCDHLDEVYHIEALAKKLGRSVPIGLRIYFEEETMHWDRFGFSAQQASTWSLIRHLCDSQDLVLKGVHVHIGTNIRKMSVFSKLGHCLNAFCIRLKQSFGVELASLDVGGGLAGISPRIEEKQLVAHALPDVERYSDAIITPLLPYLRSLREPAILFFEPGRTLFEAFGSLLTRVVGRRESNTQGESAYILDAGINSLSTSHVYDFPVQVFSQTMPYQKAKLLGPTCNQKDQLHSALELPALQIGDPVLFHGVGSYCMAFSFNFIRLRPGVILKRSRGDFVWLRKPENLEHLQLLDVLPES